MRAKHFSSVLFPLPLRPTIPNASPWATVKLTSRSAGRASYLGGAKGWTTRSWSVEYFSWGRRNALFTRRADTAAAAVTPCVEGSSVVWASGRANAETLPADRGPRIESAPPMPTAVAAEADLDFYGLGVHVSGDWA